MSSASKLSQSDRLMFAILGAVIVLALVIAGIVDHTLGVVNVAPGLTLAESVWIGLSATGMFATFWWFR